MTGASSVWNAMLGMWNRVKSEPGWDPKAVSPMLGSDVFCAIDIGSTSNRSQRNVIGTHSGSYGVYSSL